jgi:hypothetical protein
MTHQNTSPKESLALKKAISAIVMVGVALAIAAPSASFAKGRKGRTAVPFTIEGALAGRDFEQFTYDNYTNAQANWLGRANANTAEGAQIRAEIAAASAARKVAKAERRAARAAARAARNAAQGR